jgi:hypothetical protein
VGATVTDGEQRCPTALQLSTVHRTEEVKVIIRMLPIWAAGILLVTSASHNHSLAIQQARTMDRRITARLEIRVHGRWPHGVPLRSGAREHAELRRGALLADHLRRQLHGHAARYGGARVDQRGRGVASGQPQQREAGSLLLVTGDTADAKHCLLRRLRKAVHLQEVRGSRPREQHG